MMDALEMAAAALRDIATAPDTPDPARTVAAEALADGTGPAIRRSLARIVAAKIAARAQLADAELRAARALRIVI